MTEETAQSSPVPTVAKLDDVIAEFKASFPTPTAEPTIAEPAAPPAPAPVIDPLDDNQWAQYQQRQAQQTTALQSEIQKLSEKLTQQEQRDAQAKVNADIEAAVSTVSEKADIKDMDFVEFKLEKRAREDEGFRQLWENREANPKLFNKALEAFSAELTNSTEFRADPQLAENHRAAMQSQSSGTPAPADQFNNDIERELASAKTKQERDRIWQRYKNG